MNIHITQVRHVTILVCLLIATALQVAGCQSSGPTNQPPPAGDDKAVLEQSVFWETPDIALSDPPDSIDASGNQYAYDRDSLSCYDPAGELRWQYQPAAGTINGWIRQGQDIRVVEQRNYDEEVPFWIAVVAVSPLGQVQWRREMPVDVDNPPDLRRIVLAADGWFFGIVENSWTKPGYTNYVVAIDPAGQIGWTVNLQPGDSREFELEFSYLLLDDNDDLVAVDQGNSVYRYDRAGQLIESAAGVSPGFMNLVHASTAAGIYLVECELNVDNLLWDYSAETPEYFNSGNFCECSDQLVLLSPTLDAVWSVDTGSIVRCIAPRPGGGVYIGGYAGELIAYDAGGTELWRYLPDQRRDAGFAWDRNLHEHPGFTTDMPVGLVGLTARADGVVAAVTGRGLLFTLDASGHELWSWPGATITPRIENGYGADFFDFADSGSASLRWNDAGQLLCGAHNVVLTIDAVSGEPVDVAAQPGVEYIVETPDYMLRLCAGFSVAATDRHGSVLWSCTLPDRISSRPVSDESGTLYVPTVRGRIYAVTNTGGIAWRADLPGIVQSQPVIGADRNLYAVDIEGRLIAVSPGGSVRWTLDGLNRDNLRPTAGPGGLAVGSDHNSLSFIGYAGTVQWDYEIENSLIAPAAVSALNAVYFGDDGGVAYAVDSTGALIFMHADQSEWHANEFASFTEIAQPPVIMPDGGVVVEFHDRPYYGDMSNHIWSTVMCFEPDGRIRWELVGEAERERSGDSARRPDRLLVAPGLLKQTYVLLQYEGAYMLYNQDGKVRDVVIGNPAASLCGASSDIFPSVYQGFFLHNNHNEPAAFWNELR